MHSKFRAQIIKFKSSALFHSFNELPELGYIAHILLYVIHRLNHFLIHDKRKKERERKGGRARGDVLVYIKCIQLNNMVE